MEIRRINNGKIYYYHTNHLGSTAFVTEQNQNIIQGFVYAPFGEIISEYNANFGNNTIPKYSFNAKELDEETGMYYYEARYYAPPTFTSRDPLMNEKPWLTPYHYCSNNPVGRIDPTGMSDEECDDTWKYNETTKRLEWIDNKGGDDHQTVQMAKGEGKNEQITKTVDFDGQIGDMFDFSVFSPTADGVINGSLDILNGVGMFFAGAVIGVGGAVPTGGVATAAGIGICLVAGGQTASGVMQVAESLGGKGEKNNPYTQQTMAKDLCKSTGNSGVELISRTKTGNWKGILKNIGKSVTSFSISSCWSSVQKYTTKHPNFKGIPKGANIK